jgi:2-polyprenyl-3-methyl-5-hydroxy-6-metoxy-1,4-benzoquinol methylase
VERQRTPPPGPQAYDIVYFEALESGWNRLSYPAISELVRERCPSPGDGPALDFGSGGGAYAAVLRERSARVEGCDVAEESGALAGDRYDRFFRISSSADLPTETYDLIFSSEVLEHIEDHRAALRDLYRALRPGGVMFLTTTQYAPSIFTMLYTVKNQRLGVGTTLVALRDWLLGVFSEATRDRFVRRWVYEAAGGHHHGFPRRQLVADCRAAGFDVLDSGVFYVLPPLQVPFLHSDTPRSLMARLEWSWPKRLAATALWLPLSALNRACLASGLFANNVWITARRQPLPQK